jgi:acyl carrier protein|tara:strand:+ start:1160 stop:1390 length:231 start_codon:yes stop_codon:yes gene_type:complete
MNIQQQIIDLVASHLGRDPADIKMGHHFMDDLNCDSLDTVEMVLAVEDEYNIEIPDNEAERMETVNSLVNYVKSHV